MKSKNILLGILAITLVFGMTAVGCDNDTTDKGPQPIKFVSTDTSGSTYTLVITPQTANAITAGDSYVLTITIGQTNKVSKGNITNVTPDGVLTMKPNNSSDTFIVTASGGNMTNITGNIAVDEGEPVTDPGTLTPGGNNNNNNNNNNGGNGSSVNIEMVTITAGTFTMGSPETEPGRESNETQHSVTLSAFKMGKYLVTQEQYQVVMGSNPSNFTSAVTGESGTPGKLPVESVSWYDALVFCNKLSVMEGLSPAYSISGSTDPTAWGTVPTSTL